MKANGPLRGRKSFSTGCNVHNFPAGNMPGSLKESLKALYKSSR